jgi:hypothetical protein
MRHFKGEANGQDLAELLAFWFCLPACGGEFWEIRAPLQWKEGWYGHETFIDVRDNPYLEISDLGLKRIDPGVVEICGEMSPPQYNLRNFGCLWCVEWEGVAELS